MCYYVKIICYCAIISVLKLQFSACISLTKEEHNNIAGRPMKLVCNIGTTITNTVKVSTPDGVTVVFCVPTSTFPPIPASCSSSGYYTGFIDETANTVTVTSNILLGDVNGTWSCTHNSMVATIVFPSPIPCLISENFDVNPKSPGNVTSTTATFSLNATYSCINVDVTFKWILKAGTSSKEFISMSVTQNSAPCTDSVSCTGVSAYTQTIRSDSLFDFANAQNLIGGYELSTEAHLTDGVTALKSHSIGYFEFKHPDDIEFSGLNNNLEIFSGTVVSIKMKCLYTENSKLPKLIYKINDETVRSTPFSCTDISSSCANTNFVSKLCTTTVQVGNGVVCDLNYSVQITVSVLDNEEKTYADLHGIRIKCDDGHIDGMSLRLILSIVVGVLVTVICILCLIKHYHDYRYKDHTEECYLSINTPGQIGKPRSEMSDNTPLITTAIWTKDGKRVISTHGEPTVFEINDVTVQDGGIYVCTFKKTRFTYQVFVKVIEKKVHVADGEDTLSLGNDVFDNRGTNATWTKDGVDLKFTNSVPTMFTIEKSSKQHNQLYVCTFNRFSQLWYHLSVEPAEFVYIPKDDSCEIGKEIQDGASPENASWTKNRKSLTLTNSSNPTKFTISKASDKDNGNYVCMSTNRSFTIHVLVVNTEESLFVYKDDSIEFGKTMSDMNAIRNAKWTKDETKVMSKSHYGPTYFKIDNASEKDNGIYMCTFGSDKNMNFKYHVQVKEKFLYFAYGENLLKSRIDSIDSTAVKITTGHLEDFKLDFISVKNPKTSSWHGGVANITNSSSSLVWGTVWELNYESKMKLKSQNEENTYTNICVECKDDKYRTCLTSICYNLNMHRWDHRPSDEYKAALIHGAYESGLPWNYITQLLDIPVNTLYLPWAWETDI